MNKTEEIKRVPVAPLPGPSGLEGVLIDGCAFTETVGKKEPRPPLFWALCTDGSGRTHDLDIVFLAVDGGRVLVKDVPPPSGFFYCEGESLGDFLPGAPKGPAYTGEIAPSMWAIIRKWWNP